MSSTEPYRGDASKVARVLGEDKATVAQAARVLKRVGARTGLLGGHRAPAAPLPAAAPVPLTTERRENLEITASQLLKRLPPDNTFRPTIEKTFQAEVRAATTDGVALAALKTLRNSVDAEVARLARLNS